MSIKKITALTAAALLMFTALYSCSAPSGSNASGKNTAMKAEFSISDWKIEDVLSQVVIDDVTVEFPCTLEKLADYEITYSDSALSALEGKNEPSMFIKHNLKDVVMVGFKKLDKVEDYKSAKINSVIINRDVNLKSYIGDFKMNASKTDIVAKYGEPNRISSTNKSAVTYLFGENYITVSYDEKDTVKKIQLYYND